MNTARGGDVTEDLPPEPVASLLAAGHPERVWELLPSLTFGDALRVASLLHRTGWRPGGRGDGHGDAHARRSAALFDLLVRTNQQVGLGRSGRDAASALRFPPVARGLTGLGIATAAQPSLAPDTGLIALVHRDGSFRVDHLTIWDPWSCRRVWWHPLPRGLGGGRFTRLLFAADGQIFACHRPDRFPREPERLLVFGYDAGSLVVRELDSAPSGFYALAPMPAGPDKAVCAVRADGEMTVWPAVPDGAPGHPRPPSVRLPIPAGHELDVGLRPDANLAVSADGERICLVTRRRPGTARQVTVADRRTGKELAAATLESAVAEVSFLPDGETAASRAGSTVSFFGGSAPVADWPVGPAQRALFLPDGEHVLVAHASGSIEVHTWPDRALVGFLSGPEFLITLTVSPAGDRVVALGERGRVQTTVWDSAVLRLLHRPLAEAAPRAPALVRAMSAQAAGDRWELQLRALAALLEHRPQPGRRE
ncbi:conserved hypothetical protein [Parafrankia sp. Ea1.12]|uniref:WD40 repeat domain-containing protein n=1 Tax=Parafrankia sp. Ea1.12 TaxID=573499 RepID=UPI000DA564AB|nr:hypothetical protein [Parafrankia sp. Ea1.12]SQD95492.1 conserved hypothetical protein [Parafrankia sp. Ea1.12]